MDDERFRQAVHAVALVLSQVGVKTPSDQASVLVKVLSILIVIDIPEKDRDDVIKMTGEALKAYVDETEAAKKELIKNEVFTEDDFRKVSSV